MFSPSLIKLRLGPILDDEDFVRLASDATNAQKVEKKYRRIFREAINEAAARALQDLASNLFRPEDYDFEGLIVDHAIESSRAATRKRTLPTSRLTKKTKTPLVGLFEMWDAWRKGRLTTEQKKDAEKIKKTFLKTVQKFWKKNSEKFRQGDAFDMEAAKKAFKEAAKIPVMRANMIVNTETTNYYNDTLVKIYDQADGVTHYFFVAIRDHRTTPWCWDYKKGGRDGLVYVKGEAITRREKPACHWNCRSQYLPLSPSNPKHLRLIEDKSRWRSNNSPTPLPKGWG